MEQGDLKEMAQEARLALEKERGEWMEKVARVDGLLRTLEATDEVLTERDSLRREVEMLRGQLQEEKELRVKVEMQLKEMSKLSASVAGKASQDEVLKALRVFVNKSKRKKLEKRIAVKEIVLELAMANGIAFPEELATSIDSLDDEQMETKPATGETHNHFAAGSNCQVFNDKVSGQFENMA